jgi:Bacterial extracellular solute-binding protein
LVASPSSCCNRSTGSFGGTIYDGSKLFPAIRPAIQAGFFKGIAVLNIMVKRQSICFVSFVLSVALCGCNSHAKSTTLTLSLAASLKNAMSEIEGIYARQHPEIILENNYGSSGTLTQQIEQGAPVDVFLSAAFFA